MSAPYKLVRTDRASRSGMAVGTPLYYGSDGYGCASDDSRVTGIEHVSVSVNESGVPFFTIPRADIEFVKVTP